MSGIPDTRRPRRLPWWAALAAAATGGVLIDTSTPALAWWPAAFLGTALVIASVWQQRAGLGALAGAVAGAAFWMPHISWLTLYLGPVPWLGLCGVMIAWFALFGLAAAVATRGIERIAGRLPVLVLTVAQAIAVAGLWVLREQLQGSWPYGGFAWGRLAHTQSESPLGEAVSWLGFAGLSGLIALVCAIPVSVLLLSARPRTAPRRAAVAAFSGALVLLIIAGLVPSAPLERSGTLRVAAVQGDSKSGIFDDRESGQVLRDHLDATAALLDRLEAEGESVDVIVWPENSAEFDLPGNELGGFRVAKLAQRAGAPILVGSILRGDDGSYTNSSLVWGPDGEVEGERYDKRYPVPFAEYMPNREFFHALAPDLVDLVQLEYTAGTRPPVIEVEAGSTRETVRAGLAICFDIIFDGQAVAAMDGGAEVIFAQTNNADFGRTDESAQQLAIARLRAVETGRALVNISTVGTSAMVAPDGRDLDRLVPFTADAMVAEVPLVEGMTPALRFGSLIAAAWMLAGAAGLVAGALGALGAIRSRGEARAPRAAVRAGR